MLADIVIDTNVFMHAHDERQPWCVDCITLVKKLTAAKTVLRVDEGFHIDEAKNRSRIMSEYLAHLSPGMLGFALISTLASTGRVQPTSVKVDPQLSKLFRQWIKDRRDVCFVRVAANSKAKILVSHDFAAASSAARKALAHVVGIVEAKDAHPRV